MNNITYLDTSGLNFLADYIGDDDIFRFWKSKLKIDFCISSIVLWEILLNSDDARKDYLIYWSQFNCSEYLLKSPSEIFIMYLEKDCPLKDKKEFWYNRETNLEIGSTWKNIHGNIEKTIPIDLGKLKERSQPIRELSKKLKSIIYDMCNKDSHGYENDPFHEAMHRALKKLKLEIEITPSKEKLLKLSLAFMFFFVCIGMELDNTPIKNYWAKVEIDDPLDRFDWIIDNQPKIIVRGPILEMAKMAESQFLSANSSSRGLLHDCLHSVYCYYTDNILSDDDHFKNLKKNEEHFAFEGIIMVDDFKEMWCQTMKELTNRCT